MTRNAFARTIGALYVLNIAIGIYAMMQARQGHTGLAAQLNVAGGAEYAAIVLMLGKLFEPAGRAASWTVAAIGALGCAITPGAMLHLYPVPVNPLAVFGVYCIGLGLLVLRSNLVPRVLGGLLALGGLAWLTYLSPSLGQQLAPYNVAAGAIPEMLFTLYLLAFGVRDAHPAAAEPIAA